MHNIGFTDTEIEQVLNIVIAIMVLGNVEFHSVPKSGHGDETHVTKNSAATLSQVASLLQMTPEDITKAITTKVQVIGKDVIKSPLSLQESY